MRKNKRENEPWNYCAGNKVFFEKKEEIAFKVPFGEKGDFSFLECVGTISRDTFSGLTEIRVPYVQEMRFNENLNERSE